MRSAHCYSQQRWKCRLRKLDKKDDKFTSRSCVLFFSSQASGRGKNQAMPPIRNWTPTMRRRKMELGDIAKWHPLADKCLIPFPRSDGKWRDGVRRSALLSGIWPVRPCVQSHGKPWWKPTCVGPDTEGAVQPCGTHTALLQNQRKNERSRN